MKLNATTSENVISSLRKMLDRLPEAFLTHVEAPSSFCRDLCAIVEAKGTTQLNLPDFPFTLRSSDDWPEAWGTYDGCRSACIDKTDLRVRIYDGDSYDGTRLGLRGEWRFSLTDEVLAIPNVHKIVETYWSRFVSNVYESEKHQAKLKEIEDLSNRLLAE